MYKYHPEIEGLKVNEDGSEILLNGKRIWISKTKKGRVYVSLFDRMVNVTRLICECWNGEAPDSGAIVCRKDGDKANHHYTNLYWCKKGGASKLNDEQRKDVIERLEKGESQASIARDYGVSRNLIYKVNKQRKNNG